ncbi:MAG TPA: phage holin family protein [Acidimicrobiia bacterium]
MANPQEIPQLTTELFEMTKEYLRQETIEPAKRLGRQAGLGLGGAMLMSSGAFLLVLGAYFAYRMLLPDGEWWEILARGLTALTAAIGAMLVAWRIGARSANNP